MKYYLELVHPNSDILKRQFQVLQQVPGFVPVGARALGIYFEVDIKIVRNLKLSMLYEDKRAENKNLFDIIFDKKSCVFIKKEEIKWWGATGSSGTAGTSGSSTSAISTGISTGMSGCVGISGGCFGT